ncbi:MAG: hypothetical protein Q4Q58_01305 [Thermoplasmata archaeon]|nr:hypothetical protein [Thermoplasmata archaeon]
MTRDRSFALSVSDALPPDLLADRIRHVSTLARGLKSMNHICIRDDIGDPMMFSMAAVFAESTGLEVILESPDLACLAAAVGAMDTVPTLLSPEADQTALLTIAADTRSAVVVSSYDPEELPALAQSALNDGCEGVFVHPIAQSMKTCLESTVRTKRLCDIPVVCRAWSGEYALSLSSVCFLRGGSLAVLDDLDPTACSVLDSLIRNLYRCSFRCRHLSKSLDAIYDCIRMDGASILLLASSAISRGSADHQILPHRHGHVAGHVPLSSPGCGRRGTAGER